MNGVAIALQTPEKTEGEDADGEADEGHDDTDASDDGQEQLVWSNVALEEKRVKKTCVKRQLCKARGKDPVLVVSTLNVQYIY